MMDLALVSALRSRKLWACSKLRQDEASGAMFDVCCLLLVACCLTYESRFGTISKRPMISCKESSV